MYFFIFSPSPMRGWDKEEVEGDLKNWVKKIKWKISWN